MGKMESDVLPAIRKLPGFQRFHLVRTSETTTVHVGVFDTPEHAEQGRSSVYPLMRDTVTPHAASPPDVQHGDIRISVWTGVLRRRTESPPRSGATRGASTAESIRVTPRGIERLTCR